MQSLKFDDLRIEIFAPHAPSFASATRAQPLRSTPDTLLDTSASTQIVSFELGTPPIFAQDDPPAVSFGMSAQATSPEPSASTAPNTPLVTLIAPASPSSLAAPKAQAIQPAASSTLDTTPKFTATTDSISSALSMPNTVPAMLTQKTSFHSSDATAASARTSVLAPPSAEEVVSTPIIYLHALEFSADGVGEIYELVSRRSGADFVLAAIYLNETQWGEKLSPWAAKSPFKGVCDFVGGGAAHLKKFADELIPRIERHVFGAGKPAWRACGGYSLAGLFSAYAAFASDKFQKIACVSASFWFSGFDAFVAAHSPQRGLAHVYASLGEAEMNPKNPRGALCGETARNFIAKRRSAGASAEFEQNPGGHMQDEIARISKALLKLVNS